MSECLFFFQKPGISYRCLGIYFSIMYTYTYINDQCGAEVLSITYSYYHFIFAASTRQQTIKVAPAKITTHKPYKWEKNPSALSPRQQWDFPKGPQPAWPFLSVPDLRMTLTGVIRVDRGHESAVWKIDRVNSKVLTRRRRRRHPRVRGRKTGSDTVDWDNRKMARTLVEAVTIRSAPAINKTTNNFYVWSVYILQG